MSNFERAFGDVDSKEAFINQLQEVVRQAETAQEFLTKEDLYIDVQRLTRNFGEKTWIIKDLVAAIGDWEADQSFTTLECPADREVVLTNLGFLFPKHFSLLKLSDYCALSSFGFTNACRILKNPRSAKFILDETLSSPELCSRLSPGLRMAIAFGATYYSFPDEESLLTSLATNTPLHPAEQDTAVVNAVNERLRNLKRSKSPFRERHGGRTALFVTGQLRGPMSVLSEVRSRFALPNVDIFVSTWKRPGRIKIDRARASRVFTPEATQEAIKLSESQFAALDNVVEKSGAFEHDDLQKNIADELGITDLDRINIQDEDVSVFNRMTNHEKMYFHNTYWPSTFGAGWLSSNYDYVVKVRPDLRLEMDSPLTLEDLRNTHGIATESSWKLEGWGFGIGDQIMYGRSDVMERLMSVWHSHCRSAFILTSGLGRPGALLGHANLGIELWLSGYEPVKMKFKHRGYLGDPPIDVDELAELIQRID